MGVVTEFGVNKQMKEKISIVVDIIIIILVVIGTIIMFMGAADETGLTASGFYNLKYFTVLSNEFCGIVTIIDLIKRLLGKSKVSLLMKYMAVTSVGLTFSIIAFFLQPMYREMNMYKGGNLVFHLIVPVIAMLGFVLLDKQAPDEVIPFRYTIIAAIPSVIYGFGYMINILINGKGEWPNTNDWYGFLNWGWSMGVVIFAGVVLINWIVALVIRVLFNKRK